MKIEEIKSKKTWEEFIARYSSVSLFQSWSWGETVKGIKNMVWRLGIYDGEKLIGIVQVVKVQAKKGSFLHLRHGPILSAWKREYVNFLLDHLKNLAKREHAIFIRMSPLIENVDSNKLLCKSFGFINAPIHELDGGYCWVLDLDKTEEELLVNMRKTTRYLIRQAERQGVTLVKSRKVDDLEDFFLLYEQTAKRHHFVRHTGIEEEFVEFLKDDQIMLFKGFYQKKLLSAALIVFYQNQGIYHHSASIEQRIPVNYLLQWEAIKEAKKQGKAVYNFWGIAPEGRKRHPWRGLSLFKTGFGGRLIEYLHTQDLPLSPLYCTTYMIDWFRKIRKGY